MSLIICPPVSQVLLYPEWPAPHPGFGTLELYRNGVNVWWDVWGDYGEEFTVGMLTEWCPVRQGVGWKLVINGPMVRETYRLRRAGWTLVERENGFA